VKPPIRWLDPLLPACSELTRQDAARLAPLTGAREAAADRLAQFVGTDQQGWPGFAVVVQRLSAVAECCFEVAPVDADQAEDDIHLGEPHRAAHRSSAGFAVSQDLPGCCLGLVVLAEPLVAAGCVERPFRPVEREVAGLTGRREPVQACAAISPVRSRQLHRGRTRRAGWARAGGGRPVAGQGHRPGLGSCPGPAGSRGSAAGRRPVPQGRGALLRRGEPGRILRPPPALTPAPTMRSVLTHR